MKKLLLLITLSMSFSIYAGCYNDILDISSRGVANRVCNNVADECYLNALTDESNSASGSAQICQMLNNDLSLLEGQCYLENKDLGYNPIVVRNCINVSDKCYSTLREGKSYSQLEASHICQMLNNDLSLLEGQCFQDQIKNAHVFIAVNQCLIK